MSYVSMKSLLEAGVHFGHQTRRWNPKMKPYIFTERNGIYIIDLLKTSKLLNEASDYVRDLAKAGKQVLFVSTKKQAQDIMKEQAELVNMPHVSFRWLGGMLTNYDTVKRRIHVLQELEGLIESGDISKYPKKEQSALRKKKEKLEKNLGGLRDMKGLPAAMFVIDPKRESIAIKEARKLGIKIISIVDTNCDPDVIDFIIPGNDDAIRAVRLITTAITDAVKEGIEGRDNEITEDSFGTPEEIVSILPASGSISEEEAEGHVRHFDVNTAKKFEKGELDDIDEPGHRGDSEDDKIIITEDYA